MTNATRIRKGRGAGVVITAMVIAWLVATFSRAGSVHSAGLSRESLQASFASDMRNVAYRWSPDDGRSDEENRAALFDFVYQTYDSSAWIPQSLFDGNLATQAIVGDIDTIVRDKVGLVLWRDNPRVPTPAALEGTGDLAEEQWVPVGQPTRSE